MLKSFNKEHIFKLTHYFCVTHVQTKLYLKDSRGIELFFVICLSTVGNLYSEGTIQSRTKI